jgi:hypothetical protein
VIRASARLRGRFCRRFVAGVKPERLEMAMTRMKSRALRAALLWIPVLVSLSSQSTAGGESVEAPTHTCAADESWDNAMSMCMPSAQSGTARTIVSGQFNVFGVFSDVPGPRGIEQFAAPNMFMLDAGRALGSRQFLNLDLMGTTELWTYPARGYPELLQIGEERSDGSPYIDAQHPHSSPIMGLTLSDMIALGSSNTLKLFFAPRGESTDGPIAYMHRDSAQDDPDAPLGHHVGQDVGHISSTVLGAQLTLGPITVEASAFNGEEPQPTKVDLPLEPLDSEALRVTYAFQPDHRLMVSVAHVDQQDPTYPGTTSATRVSASLYDRFALHGWTLDHSFVVGHIARYPDGTSETSLLDEALWARGSSDVWGRIEILQRLASELEIPSAYPPYGADDRRWVSALTLGYTHWTQLHRGLQFGLGTSLTLDVIPGDWAAVYGSRTPLTVRFIIQVRGAGRWPH